LETRIGARRDRNLSLESSDVFNHATDTRRSTGLGFSSKRIAGWKIDRILSLRGRRNTRALDNVPERRPRKNAHARPGSIRRRSSPLVTIPAKMIAATKDRIRVSRRPAKLSGLRQTLSDQDSFVFALDTFGACRAVGR
jgi:hypothetical protein